jgi:hypothetical protein
MQLPEIRCQGNLRRHTLRARLGAHLAHILSFFTCNNVRHKLFKFH